VMTVGSASFGYGPRILIQEPDWPPGLSAEHRRISDSAWQLFRAAEYRGAAEGFDVAYRVLISRQPEGRRFHKGESLHNKGLALMWAGDTRGALSATLAAFVEDAASLAEEDPRPVELDRPAAHNLVHVFSLAGPQLATFAVHVRQLVIEHLALPDPYQIVFDYEVEHLRPRGGCLFALFPAADILEERWSVERVSEAIPLRIPGVFSAPPGRRVFIGGWYGRIDETLRPLRDHLTSIGYDGVIAGDFATPAGWGQDEVAKGLMGLCHYGVFEVSESAGQVEEVAFTPDTMRSPNRMVAVFDRRRGLQPGISAGMTLEKLNRWGIEQVGYEDVDGLKAFVKKWLKDGAVDQP